MKVIFNRFVTNDGEDSQKLTDIKTRHIIPVKHSFNAPLLNNKHNNTNNVVQQLRAAIATTLRFKVLYCLRLLSL